MLQVRLVQWSVIDISRKDKLKMKISKEYFQEEYKIYSAKRIPITFYETQKPQTDWSIYWVLLLSIKGMNTTDKWHKS